MALYRKNRCPCTLCDDTRISIEIWVQHIGFIIAGLGIIGFIIS